MADPLTPKGKKPMVALIEISVNYYYASSGVLRKITGGETDGYTNRRGIVHMASATPGKEI